MVINCHFFGIFDEIKIFNMMHKSRYSFNCCKSNQRKSFPNNTFVMRKICERLRLEFIDNSGGNHNQSKIDTNEAIWKNICQCQGWKY